VLKRNIELDDPSEPSFGKKIGANAKRLCTIFAVAALALATLDLANVRSLGAASAFVHSNSSRIASLPGVVRAGFINAAVASPSPEMVIVPIPGGDIASSLSAPPMPPSLMPDPPPRPLHDKVGHSPVKGLSDARHEDAVELAMAAPAVMPKMPALPHAEVKAPAAPKLASRDADIPPPPALISAPSVAAIAQKPIYAAEPPVPVAPVPPETTAATAAPAATEASAAPETTDVTAAPETAPVVLPAVLSVLPPPAPGLPPPSPAQRLHLDGAERAKAERCLSNAIYFEARDQPFRGQVAVAQVVINRVFSPFYPKDVCGVVYQNASHYLGCQFTFACDGKRKVINEFGAWALAKRIAKQTLDGQLYVPAVGTATHYHAVYVHPVWVREMRRLVREGIHNFYRPIAWGNGADEPIWARAAMASAKTASLASYSSSAVKKGQ